MAINTSPSASDSASASSNQPSSSALSSSTTSSRTLCGPSCSACANNDTPSLTPSLKNKRSLKIDEVSLKKRVFDQPSNDPWNDNMAQFIADQSRWHSTGFVPHGDPESHPSSSQFEPLGKLPFTFGVNGLYGCTSLIVHSTKGVWISHFFEDLSFFSLTLNYDVRDPAARRSRQQALFQEQIIDLLGPGDSSGLFVGLNTFMGADGATGGPFSEDASVEAVIITPENENGDRVYEDMAEQIAAEVTRLFGGIRDADDNGRLASEVEFINYISQEPTLGFTTNGLALFQYEPVQARCQNPHTGELAQFAQRRLWFESENNGPLVLDSWQAWPEQVVPATSQQPGSRRRNTAANETHHELAHAQLGRHFRRSWTPGVQPSLYPACLAALESAPTGPVPTAAVSVGPDGPLSAPPPTLSTSITTPTTTSSATEATPSQDSPSCVHDAYFETLAGCRSECLDGICEVSSRGQVKKRCPGCGSWGPSLEVWRCGCFDGGFSR